MLVMFFPQSATLAEIVCQALTAFWSVFVSGVAFDVSEMPSCGATSLHGINPFLISPLAREATAPHIPVGRGG